VSGKQDGEIRQGQIRLQGNGNKYNPIPTNIFPADNS